MSQEFALGADLLQKHLPQLLALLSGELRAVDHAALLRRWLDDLSARQLRDVILDQGLDKFECFCGIRRNEPFSRGSVFGWRLSHPLCDVV